jgi:hypothetical protein
MKKYTTDRRKNPAKAKIRTTLEVKYFVDSINSYGTTLIFELSSKAAFMESSITAEQFLSLSAPDSESMLTVGIPVFNVLKLTSQIFELKLFKSKFLGGISKTLM